MISIVVAMDEHRLIGNKGHMPWYCPADLQHFKKLTLHHNIVMGKTTYEGLPKTLEERIIHVVTRNLTYENEDVHVCNDLQMLLVEWKSRKETLFVCGGADVYRQSLPYADELWISYIHGTYDGDTWFPPFSPCTISDTSSPYKEVMKEEQDGFTLVQYVRIK